MEKIVFTLGQDLSTSPIVLHTAIANKLGLNLTDHKALGLMTDRFSDRELAIVDDFLTQCIDILQTETAKYRDLLSVFWA